MRLTNNHSDHLYFTNEEMKRLREYLGAYSEVITPYDINFLVFITKTKWNICFNMLLLNQGHFSKTISCIGF